MSWQCCGQFDCTSEDCPRRTSFRDEQRSLSLAGGGGAPSKPLGPQPVHKPVQRAVRPSVRRGGLGLLLGGPRGEAAQDAFDSSLNDYLERDDFDELY